MEASAQRPGPGPGPKVFGLGLSRTGTHSLTAALARLGFDVVHYPTDPTTIRELMSGHFDLTLLRRHAGITDITTVPFFQALDVQYPGSKFILTVRDKPAWIESITSFLERRSPAAEPARYRDRPELQYFRRFLRERAYGVDHPDRDQVARAFDRHRDAVMGYFTGRPRDLLVLDVAAGEGFEKLCPFLGVPVLDEPFPQEGGRPDPTDEADIPDESACAVDFWRSLRRRVGRRGR